MLEEARTRAPIAQPNKDAGEREYLSDFNANIETYNVGDESILREREFLKFGRETETVEQTKNQNGQTRVRLKMKKPLESIHVVECFVDDGKTDDRIDQIRICMD